MIYKYYNGMFILLGLSFWLIACSTGKFITKVNAATSNDSGITISTLPVPPPAMKEKLEMGPVTIEALGNRIVTHNNTLWSSRSASYRLYVGGNFTAEYSQVKGTLLVTAENGANRDAISCIFLMNGTLEYKDKKEKKKAKKKRITSCNKLLNTLETYLVDK